MKYLFIAAAFFSFPAMAQKNYADSIYLHRKHYKEGFIKEERSPLKGNDTSFLRFYEPDIRYRVVADFSPTPDAQAFDMPTYSGKTKQFRQYGIARFILNDTIVSLCVYQNQKLLEEKKYKNHLFIPFTDGTSYVDSYAGGRYLDLETTDIRDGKLVIDFNKCYNPYCAYSSGFNCPVPPVENRMDVCIKAGEKTYAGKHKD